MSGSSVLITRNGSVLTRADILARAGILLGALNLGAARPHLLPLCSRHADFMTAIVMGRCAGLPIVLPNDPNPVEIGKVAADVGGDIIALVSDGDRVGEISGVRRVHRISTADDEIPAAPLIWDEAGASTITLYTSGTTGAPVPHSHTFAAFDRGAPVWADRLGVADKSVTVVSTVPPQHMYGLEASVLLPLCVPRVAVSDARPFYAASVAEALASAGSNAVLVTTPFQLDLLVREGISLTPLHAIVSATSPLPIDVARAAETMFAAPVIEIFGTTETGLLASREPVRNETFSLRSDVTVLFDERRMIVRRAAGSPDIVIDDAVVPDGAGFRYVGRGDDLINIAGKRASLSGLTQALRAVDGVEDGAFVLQDAVQGGSTQPRLAAFVVAPNLSLPELKTALRKCISPTFLPRRIVFLNALPKTATGKTKTAALLQMLGNNRRSFEVTSDHPALAGHFPGNPVVPGVVILDHALRTLGLTAGSRFRSVKFKGVLRPNQACIVEMCEHANGVLIRCSAGGREIMVAEMKRAAS